MAKHNLMSRAYYLEIIIVKSVQNCIIVDEANNLYQYCYNNDTIYMLLQSMLVQPIAGFAISAMVIHYCNGMCILA